jgi:hypothetical protein
MEPTNEQLKAFYTLCIRVSNLFQTVELTRYPLLQVGIRPWRCRRLAAQRTASPLTTDKHNYFKISCSAGCKLGY